MLPVGSKASCSSALLSLSLSLWLLLRFGFAPRALKPVFLRFLKLQARKPQGACSVERRLLPSLSPSCRRRVFVSSVLHVDEDSTGELQKLCCLRSSGKTELARTGLREDEADAKNDAKQDEEAMKLLSAFLEQVWRMSSTEEEEKESECEGEGGRGVRRSRDRSDEKKKKKKGRLRINGKPEKQPANLMFPPTPV